MKKNNKISKVKKHLRDDIKTFHEEASDDKKLIKSLGSSKSLCAACKGKSKSKKKMPKKKK